MKKSWTIYMLLLKNGHYYTGITVDLDRRLKAHEAGKGSKYVRSHLPFTLAYTGWASSSRSWAQKLEHRVKNLPHKDKEELAKFYSYLKICNSGKGNAEAYKEIYEDSTRLP